MNETCRSPDQIKHLQPKQDAWQTRKELGIPQAADVRMPEYQRALRDEAGKNRPETGVRGGVVFNKREEGGLI